MTSLDSPGASSPATVSMHRGHAVQMRISATLLPVLFCACGGLRSTASDAGATGDAGSTAVPLEDAIAPLADASPPSSPCPSSPPAHTGPCPDLGCEYGTSPFLVCDTVADCNDGIWVVEPPIPALCTASTTACAGSSPAQGAPCPEYAVNNGTGCDTADGLWCNCYAGQPTAIWMCTSHGPGCPPARPRLGSPCTLEAGSQCSYAGVAVMECTAQGVWIMRVNP